MGALDVLKNLAREMEAYLGARGVLPEDLPGTRFWLQQVRETIKLYDSFETPPSDRTFISNLLAEYSALNPDARMDLADLMPEEKAASAAQGKRYAEDLERRRKADLS